MFSNLRPRHKAVAIMLVIITITAYVKYQWETPRMSQISMQYLQFFRDTGAVGIARLIKEDARKGREFSKIALARAANAWAHGNGTDDIERAVRYLLPNTKNQSTIEKYSDVSYPEDRSSSLLGWLGRLFMYVIGCYFMGMIPYAILLCVYNSISPQGLSRLESDLDDHTLTKMLVIFLHGVVIYIIFS